MTIHSSSKQDILDNFNGTLTKRNAFGKVQWRMKTTIEQINKTIDDLDTYIKNGNNENYYKDYRNILIKSISDINNNNDKVKELCQQDDAVDFNSRQNFFKDLKDSNWNKFVIPNKTLFKEEIVKSTQENNLPLKIKNLFFTNEKTVFVPPINKQSKNIFFIKIETVEEPDYSFRVITDIISGNLFDTNLLKKIPNNRFSYQNYIVTNAQICFSNNTFHQIDSEHFPFDQVENLKFKIQEYSDSIIFTDILKNSKSQSLLRDILLNDDILK